MLPALFLSIAKGETLPPNDGNNTDDSYLMICNQGEDLNQCT